MSTADFVSMTFFYKHLHCGLYCAENRRKSVGIAGMKRVTFKSI